MKFSRYNYLKYSEKYGALLFNTRTRFFISLSRQLFAKLEELSKLNYFEVNTLGINQDIIEKLIKGKVFVQQNEDVDFYELKKFLRYKQAFACNSLSIVLLPTFSCNFKCPYCYENNLPPITITEEVIEGIYSFIKKKNQNNIDLCWHGGEPLIAFDKMLSFLNKIRNDKSLSLRSHSMVTNAFLLDERKCKILSDYNLNKIQITVDGNKAYHNKSRIHKSGIPTYDIIMNNIENVFRYMPDCHVIVRVNLHSENKDTFPLLYKEMKERWGDQNYSINVAFVNDVNNSCKVACLADKGKISFVRSLYEQYGINDIDVSTQPQIGGCAASCINSYVIGPSGEIYKCWVDVGKKEKVVSNVFDGKLANYILPTYTVGSDMFSDKRCKDCVFMPICDGGCIERRYTQNHNKISYDPCPIDEDDFLSLIELYYIKSMKDGIQ